jgi:hypothetical protein
MPSVEIMEIDLPRGGGGSGEWLNPVLRNELL